MLLRIRLPQVRASSLLLSLSLSFGMLACDVASAQLPLRGAGAERGRFGLLGGRREAREERLNRLPPAPAPSAADRLAPPTAGEPAVRSAFYGRPTEAGASDRRVPAAAPELPTNRLPYTGKGVSVRLPIDLPGEVNYVLDDAEHLVIHSGQEQQLRLKGTYEIRFSRGVSDDGRSFGEARYTISEGSYRFAVTEQGWDLYREADALQPRALSAIQAQALPAASEETLPVPSPRSILER